MRRSQQPRRYPRTARVNEVVLEVLADELERLSDPRLGFVTFTGVEVSADLRHANVFYSVINTTKGGIQASEAQHTATAEALRSAGPHLRAVLGRQVRLKYLPELVFHEDPAIAQGERVEQLLRGLRDAEAPGAGEAE
jgi:ribosome-binding factor A